MEWKNSAFRSGGFGVGSLPEGESYVTKEPRCALAVTSLTHFTFFPSSQPTAKAKSFLFLFSFCSQKREAKKGIFPLSHSLELTLEGEMRLQARRRQSPFRRGQRAFSACQARSAKERKVPKSHSRRANKTKRFRGGKMCLRPQ